MRISDWSSDVCSSDLFRFDAILEAHRRREAPADATDDAQVAREAGFQVATVIGSQSLEKLTYEEDFMRAEQRSEESREGKECVSTCKSRWSPYQSKNNKRAQVHITHQQIKTIN